MTKPKIPDTLNPQQAQFAINRLKYDDKTAYMKAYPNSSPDSATTSAIALKRNHPEIVEWNKAIFEAEGVTMVKLAKKVNKKLDAKKPLVINNNLHSFVDDNANQLKAIELGLKVHGALKDNDHSVNIQHNEQHNTLIMDKLDSRLDKVVSLLTSLRGDKASSPD